MTGADRTGFVPQCEAVDVDGDIRCERPIHHEGEHEALMVYTHYWDSVETG